MTIIYVKPNGDKTIPAAIRESVPGDTIELGDGVYPAFLIERWHGTYFRRLTIQGEPGAEVVIDSHQKGSHPYHCIHFRYDGSYCTLRNLTVTTSDPVIDKLRQLNILTPEGLSRCKALASRYDLRNKGGIRFNGNRATPFNAIVVEQCHAHGLPSYGISGNLRNSVIQNNCIRDLGQESLEGYGMYFWGSSGMRVERNVVDDCTGWGLTTSGMRRSSVINNIVANTRWPHYHYDSKTVKDENDVGGISSFKRGMANRYLANRIWGSWYGIWIFAGDRGAKLNGNEISQTHRAIYVEPGADAKLAKNRLWGNVVDVG